MGLNDKPASVSEHSPVQIPVLIQENCTINDSVCKLIDNKMESFWD